MKPYVYEGKTEEELILKALNELEVKEDELFFVTKEEVAGLLKKKKVILKVIKKSEVLEYSKKFLKELTCAMGLEVNLETKRKENHILIKLHSNNNPILIGKNGKTLEALQVILRQSIYIKTGVHANMVLDVEDYKEKHQRSIEFLSKKLAKEVLQTGIEIKMDSMNSYERRLVHNVLKDFKGIKTESEGEEPNRCVVIKLSK
ncbi:MAG: KH domain-containing protein [Bacilli bacterium]|nr:KH domain-containing protein [Bacilli bacterium]